MKSKRLMLGAILALFVGAGAWAGPHGQHDPQAHVERLATELGLDDVQADQVAQILTEQRDKYRSLHRELRDQGVERGSDEARALHAQAREETRQRLSTVLTAEQLDAFDELRSQRMQHRKRGRRDRGESEAL